MDTAVLVIHFGEPDRPNSELVRSYLEHIFFQNAELEEYDSEASARERAAELAARRAPSLIEEYELIDGSPLNAQAERQCRALEETLSTRGFPALTTAVAYQFLEPTIEDVLQRFQETGIEHVIALPVYPICGPSTTVAALERVHEAVEDMHDWTPEVTSVSGWHRHPRYLQLRADNIRSFVADHEFSLDDPDVTMVFSAHGTPQYYLDDGSRYRIYVEEIAGTIADLLGIDNYELGFQNHENRDIPWTEPEIEAVIESIDAECVVVEPMSFMHEQSETLVELDHDLAAVAEAVNLEFSRIPVPHDDSSFPELLADLVIPILANVDPALYQLRSCQCANTDRTYCLNAPR